MTREDLFEVLGDLEDDLVLEARMDKRRRPSWRAIVPAACLCAVAVVAVLWLRSPPMDSGSLDGEPWGYNKSCEAAPMVCVGRGLYRIMEEQPELEGREAELFYLGEISSRVDSSQKPRVDFQANDEIIGAKVYKFDENIVVDIDGKYWLYELVYNYMD